MSLALLPICSAAIIVVPLPPNESRTISPGLEELHIRYANNGTGFIVGCSPFLVGFAYDKMVVCFLSEYQLWLAPSFHP